MNSDVFVMWRMKAWNSPRYVASAKLYSPKPFYTLRPQFLNPKRPTSKIFNTEFRCRRCDARLSVSTPAECLPLHNKDNIDNKHTAIEEAGFLWVIKPMTLNP